MNLSELLMTGLVVAQLQRRRR